MPYRGTNAKRKVVHDKSKGTIPETSRKHYLSERKEHDHELSSVKTEIQKLLNDGYRYHNQVEEHNEIHLTFTRDRDDQQTLVLKFPDNLAHLKAYLQ